jgi:hypothetical protein
LVEQHGLTNAGRPFDQQDAPGARDRFRQGGVERAKVFLAVVKQIRRLLAGGKDFGRHFGCHLCRDAAFRTIIYT